MNPTRNRSSIIYLLLFVAIISMVVINFQQNSSAQKPLTINEVAEAIQRGEVQRIVEDDNRLTVIFQDEMERESHYHLKKQSQSANGPSECKVL